MRSVITLVIVLFFAQAPVQANPHGKSKVLADLAKARSPISDSEKAKLYENIVRYYIFFNQDSSELLINEADAFITKRNVKDKSYFNIKRKAIAFEKTKDPNMDPIPLYKQMLAEIPGSDTVTKFQYYFRIGGEYRAQTKFDSALLYSLKAKELAVALNDTGFIGRTIAEIAGSYMKLSMQDEALALIKDFIGDRQITNQDIHLIGTLAWCYTSKEMYQEVIDLYHKTKTDFGEKNLALSTSSVITYYCGALLANQKYAEAESEVLKYINYYKKIGNTRLLSGLYQYYASTLGKTNRLEQAINAIDSTREYRKNRLSKTFLSRYHRQKSIYYSRLNQNDSSLRHFYKFEKYLTEHYDKNAKQEYSKALALFQTKEKENANIVLQKENELEKAKTWKLRSVLIISAILLAAGILFLLFYLKQRRNKAEQVLVKAELTSIRSQMNPHFMFNALNSVKSYIIKNDSKTAARYLGKFASLMRGILDLSSEPFVTLQEELDVLKLYVDMELLRFKNKFSYRLSVDENVNKEELLVSPLFLQPFIENAIKHGLTPLEDREGILELNINKRDNLLVFEILDNGIGRPEKNMKLGHKSKGMQLSKERIAMLNQDLPETEHITIHDLTDDQGAPLGTKVVIKLAQKLRKDA